MNVIMQFPDEESGKKFLKWLKDADLSSLVDEDFYFMYSMEVYDDGTVQFNKNKSYGYTEEEFLGEEHADEEDAESDASSECYYSDPGNCRGATWVCLGGCGQTFCEFHFHDSDKGHNVECVVCERERLAQEGRFET